MADTTGGTVTALDRLRTIAERPLCPSMTEAGIRHVARNVEEIVCSCDPECPDEAWWDRYRTAGDVLAMHAALPALLDVAEAAEEAPGWDESLSAALDRLRKVTS